jgi:hypothetical protein
MSASGIVWYPIRSFLSQCGLPDHPRITMNKIALFLAAMSLSWSAVAQHSKKEVEQDIARHRAMAEAHEAAAKCLESGKKPDQCSKELQTACKGLALGKYCGMKHVH